MPLPVITSIYVHDFATGRAVTLPAVVPGVVLDPATLPAKWTIGADVAGSHTNVQFVLTDAAGKYLPGLTPDKTNRGNPPPLLTREPLVLPPGTYGLAVTAYGGPWNKNPGVAVVVTFTIPAPAPVPPPPTPTTDLIATAGTMVPCVVHVSAWTWLSQLPDDQRHMRDVRFECATAASAKVLPGFNAAFELRDPGEHVLTCTIADVLTGANAVTYTQSLTVAPDTRRTIPLTGGDINQNDVTVIIPPTVTTPGGWTVRGRNVVLRPDVPPALIVFSGIAGNVFSVRGRDFFVDGLDRLTINAASKGVNLFAMHADNAAVTAVTGLRFNDFLHNDDPVTGLYLRGCHQPLVDDGMYGYLAWCGGSPGKAGRCVAVIGCDSANSIDGSNLRVSHGTQVLSYGNDFANVDRRPFADPGNPNDPRRRDYENGCCRFHSESAMWSASNRYRTDPGSNNTQGGRLLIGPNDAGATFAWGVSSGDTVDQEIRIGAGASHVRIENATAKLLYVEAADGAKAAPVDVRVNGNTLAKGMYVAPGADARPY